MVPELSMSPDDHSLKYRLRTGAALRSTMDILWISMLPVHFIQSVASGAFEKNTPVTLNACNRRTICRLADK
jgi:hypothetical protein